MKPNKNLVQQIALERIFRLFELAEGEFAQHPERSKRYVELARKVGSRNNVTIPLELKKRFCKKCGSYLKKGANSEWAEKEKWLEIKCRECGAVTKRRLKEV
jgi:ribonuclease P protein subunit RPR2